MYKILSLCVVELHGFEIKVSEKSPARTRRVNTVFFRPDLFRSNKLRGLERRIRRVRAAPRRENKLNQKRKFVPN